MRVLAKVMVIVFAAALGVGLAYRMTPEAMAVVVGVVFGVLATIPVSLILLAVVRRHRGDSEGRDLRPGPPPVVVIQPPAAPLDQSRRQDYWLPGPPPSLDPGPQRDFRVIGDDE